MAESQPPRKSRVWALTSRCLHKGALVGRKEGLSGRGGEEEERGLPLPHLSAGWELVAAGLEGLDIGAPPRVGRTSENDGV